MSLEFTTLGHLLVVCKSQALKVVCLEDSLLHRYHTHAYLNKSLSIRQTDMHVQAILHMQE